METITLVTTVDITPTGVRNKSPADDWLMQRNQQRNYDTLIQVLGLRCQPLNPHVRQYTIDMSFMVDAYAEIAKYLYIAEELTRIWSLTFEIDRTGVYGPNGSLLLSDIDGVPIVPGLTETTPPFPPVFMSYNKFKNVHVYVEAVLP